MPGGFEIVRGSLFTRLPSTLLRFRERGALCVVSPVFRFHTAVAALARRHPIHQIKIVLRSSSAKKHDDDDDDDEKQPRDKSDLVLVTFFIVFIFLFFNRTINNETYTDNRIDGKQKFRDIHICVKLVSFRVDDVLRDSSKLR